MKTITRDDLLDLIDIAENPCISIYLPLHNTGAGIATDPLE
jgi:hypothetical protein